MTELFSGVTPDAVHWPWPSFQDAFGPMQPGELVSLMASQGAGKTTFVRSAVSAWVKQGVNLALISTEEPSEALIEKMAASEARIPERWLAYRDMSDATPEQEQAFTETYWDLMRKTVVAGLEEHGPRTMDTLLTLVGKIRDAQNSQIIILDHLHEIEARPNRHQMDEWNATVRALRDLAKAEGFVVLVIVQPKRPPLSKVPPMYRRLGLHDAKGVPAVEEASYQIFGLRRKLKPSTEQEKREMVQLIESGFKKWTDYAAFPPASEVECLKRRVWGERVFWTATLELDHGRLVDPQGAEVPF